MNIRYPFRAMWIFLVLNAILVNIIWVSVAWAQTPAPSASTQLTEANATLWAAIITAVLSLFASVGIAIYTYRSQRKLETLKNTHAGDLTTIQHEFTTELEKLNKKHDLILAGHKSTLDQYAQTKLEELKSDLEHERIQRDLFAKDQYVIYKVIWEKLQTVNLIGKNLWGEATSPVLKIFANSLLEAEELVEQRSIYFESQHLNDLRKLIKEFGQYGDGKYKLYELKYQPNEVKAHEFNLKEFQEQKAKNRAIMKKYEELLQNIQAFFRKRMSVEIETD